MPEDHRYETALKFALAITHTVDRPGMTREAKLASVTYAVLDAIYEAEGLPTPLPGFGPADRALPPPADRLNGGSHERSKLLAARGRQSTHGDR